MGLGNILLFLLPTVIGVSVLLGTPSTLKQALANSDVYQYFVPAILNESAKKATNEGDGAANAVLSDPGIRNAALSSFEPRVIQNTSETILDGIYAWLQGKTPEPTFTIDLSEPRQKLIANLTAYGKTRAAALPQCTLEQLKQLQGSRDILTIPCLPPGVDPNKAAEQFSNDLVTNAEFLNETKITSAQLTKDSSGQTVGQKFPHASEVFQALRQAPWIIGGAVILFYGGALALAADKLRAIRKILWSLVGCGIFYALLMAIYHFVSGNVATSAVSVPDAGLQSSLVQLIRALMSDYIRVVSVVALTYVASGVVGLLLAKRLQTDQKPIVTPATTKNKKGKK